MGFNPHGAYQLLGAQKLPWVPTRPRLSKCLPYQEATYFIFPYLSGAFCYYDYYYCYYYCYYYYYYYKNLKYLLSNPGGVQNVLKTLVNSNGAADMQLLS